MNRFEQMMLEFFTVTIIGFFCFILMSGIFSHAVALWIFRISLSVGIITGAGYAGIRIFQVLTKHGLKIELFRTHIRKRQNEADFGIHAIEHGLVLNYASGQAQYFTKNRIEKQPDFSVIEQPVMPENVSVINGLDVLCKCDSVLIAGGKGAGKTNLAFHLVSNQLKTGCQVFVIDPKPQFEAGKWAGARVIGVNHNYSEITSFLSDMTTLMKNDRKQIRIWIDELTILNMQIKKFASLWLPVLIEGREYGKFISIIGQSKTAGSVGLEGRYDLTDCFDAIADCKHNQAKATRFIEIEIAGDEKLITSAPEQFRMIGYHGNTATQEAFKPDKERGDSRDSRVSGDSRVIGYDADMQEITDKPIRFYESKAEKRAVEMSESGESLSKIATAVFGCKSGARVKLIKEWIVKHLPISD